MTFMIFAEKLSTALMGKKKQTLSVLGKSLRFPFGGYFTAPLWCGQQDSNLHACAVEPKSTESTNSTMPAYCLQRV